MPTMAMTSGEGRGAAITVLQIEADDYRTPFDPGMRTT